MVNIETLSYTPPALTVKDVYNTSIDEIKRRLNEAGFVVVGFRLPEENELYLNHALFVLSGYNSAWNVPRLIVKPKPKPREFHFVETDDYREANCYGRLVDGKLVTLDQKTSPLSELNEISKLAGWIYLKQVKRGEDVDTTS